MPDPVGPQIRAVLWPRGVEAGFEGSEEADKGVLRGGVGVQGFFGEAEDAVPEGPEAAFGAATVGILWGLDVTGGVGAFDRFGKGGDGGGEGGFRGEVGLEVVDDFLFGFVGGRHGCVCLTKRGDKAIVLRSFRFSSWCYHKDDSSENC